MRPIGLLLIFAAIAWPLPYFWELTAKHDSGAVLSQYLGSISLILMGISQFLATRFKGAETLFGGLDRIYLLHKWLGITAMIAMMMHDTIDAEMRNLGRETWLADMAEESGEIALYGLLILVIISLTTFVPYELWKRTHKFLGAFFTMSALHYLFILKPFENSDPLGAYISAFCFLGIASYFYTLVLHGYLARSHKYKVEGLNSHGDITEIQLTPTNTGLKHKAGQFAFLKVGGEQHPFTIASAPNESRELTFCIKQLGDFTSRLEHDLVVGDSVEVSRSFGHFIQPKAQTQVWVAGGIGITPFLAWAESLTETDGRDIHLYYCLRSTSGTIPFKEVFHNKNISVHIMNSAKGDRFSIEQVKSDLGTNYPNAVFSFCGPKGMRKLLQEDVSLNYEEFEMRSGLNLPFLNKLFLNGLNYAYKKVVKV